MPGSPFCGPHQNAPSKKSKDSELLGESPLDVISWLSYMEGELTRLRNNYVLGHRDNNGVS